jgi:hypothetical protein
MGCSGEDIWLSTRAREVFNHSVECKNQERINLKKSWAQTVANAKNYNPLLFMTWNRGDELVCMKASHYFKLLRRLEDERNHNNES